MDEHLRRLAPPNAGIVARLDPPCTCWGLALGQVIERSDIFRCFRGVVQAVLYLADVCLALATRTFCTPCNVVAVLHGYYCIAQLHPREPMVCATCVLPMELIRQCGHRQPCHAVFMLCIEQYLGPTLGWYMQWGCQLGVGTYLCR